MTDLLNVLSARRAPYILMALGWLFVPFTAIASLVAGNSLAVAPVAALAGAAVQSFAMTLPTGARNHLIAVGLMVQPVALTAALAGNGWQMDAHMVFFALLATLVCLNDIRPLITATLFVAVHHLSGALVLPTLVYPTGAVTEAILRTAMHGALVVLQAGVLVWVVALRHKSEAMLAEQLQSAQEAQAEQAKLSAQMSDALKEAELQKEAARTKSREAEAAQQAAQAEQKKTADLSDEMMRAATERQSEQDKQSAALTNVIQSLSAGLSALSAGRLAYRIDTPFSEAYEPLRHDFNNTAGTLHEAFQEIEGLSRQALAQTSEINTATASLAERTERQAHTLENTTQSVGTVAKMIETATRVAGEAAQESQKARARTDETADVLNRAAQAIAKIDASSKEITRITEVIDGISFQTNLLALNAGVEAARAGEAGLGFAVVASEVRSLAQRSSEAASNISELIETAIKEVNEGVIYVNKSVDSLNEVGEAIRSSSAKAEEIAAGTEEQRKTIHDIHASIEALDQVTQSNAAMVEETNAACQVLVGHSEQMQGLVGQYSEQSTAPNADQTARAG